MAKRKREPIQTRSFIRIDGELKEVKDLPKEVWEPIRRRLLCTYLNELYKGQAVFYFPEDEPGEKYKGGTIYESDDDRIPAHCG